MRRANKENETQRHGERREEKTHLFKRQTRKGGPPERDASQNRFAADERSPPASIERRAAYLRKVMKGSNRVGT